MENVIAFNFGQLRFIKWKCRGIFNEVDIIKTVNGISDGKQEFSIKFNYVIILHTMLEICVITT